MKFTILILSLFIIGMVAADLTSFSQLFQKCKYCNCKLKDRSRFCIDDLDCGFSPLSCNTACVNILKCLFAFCHEDKECCCYGCP
ncbi:Hypothetical predicted protein [Mytilus galloprovincialis]|uniref:Uncharacterized protein n=1 Tax=Mytilus galloprovincialis TaxID=29158 RepID=A0A8B6C6Z1_MYTGA|nr:Hypothetical predicted protein [Mytilus galloprovincialis]